MRLSETAINDEIRRGCGKETIRYKQPLLKNLFRPSFRRKENNLPRWSIPEEFVYFVLGDNEINAKSMIRSKIICI